MALVELTRPREDVALLTVNRPDKLNALNTPLLGEFADHLVTVEDDPGVRTVIITGAGDKAFVAGADIGEYAEGDSQAFTAFQLRGRAFNDRLERFPKATIAAVNGFALGGGFEIALCCDIIVATPSARFGLPEGLLGLSPGGGGSQRLLRAAGPFVAADVLLSARRLSGERAHALGLVADVVEPEQLLNSALEKAGYIARVAPLAAREMKRLLREGADAALPTALSLEQEVLFRLYSTADAGEGIRAFLAKRPATFEGR
ncbi:MAG: enoyl-CoA hydratase-related protein [Trueperaceae bacterium]